MSATQGPAAPGEVRSMTGFGRSAVARDGVDVRVEARSVNARHLKVTTRGPALLDAHQAALETLVRERVERGTVTLSIGLTRARGAAPASIDGAVLADYARQARDAARHAGLEVTEPSLDTLLRLPGVLGEPTEAALDDAEQAVLRDALAGALDALLEMRRREGEELRGVLVAGAQRIEQLAGRIEARVPVALDEHRTRLRERLTALLDGVDVPEETVAREAAVLSERTDVAEELDRLRSHAAQWRDALVAGGAVGRRLDFLAQELGREANTIGSKTGDAEIRDAVIELKLEIDRLKEQAANVE